MTARIEAPAGPWYREPWPWLLMAGPAAVVVASLFTFVLAARGADGLVAEDYYVRGLAINRDIAREQAAIRAGLVARLDWRQDPGRVEIALAALDRAALPASLRVTLVHPARASADRVLDAARGPDGVYFANAGPLPGHRWKIVIETAQWRIAGDWPDTARPVEIAPR